MTAPISGCSRYQFRRWVGSALRLSLLALLPCAARPLTAQNPISMPASLATVPEAPSADPAVSYGGLAGLRFGPNGQLYASTGTAILEQTGGYTAGFSAIGSIMTNGSDPGPFNFSQDGQTILVSNGYGGSDYTGNSNGNLFNLPVPNGSTALMSVPTAAYVGNVPNNADLIAVPSSTGIAGSANLFFVDVGTNTGSEVNVFNSATGADIPVITGIPGASSSIAIAGGKLYVGNGYDDSGMDATGQLESFSLSSLATAVESYSKTPQSPQPLSWNNGTLVSGTGGGNNSGAGIFVDPRGYLFAGGDAGLLVVTPSQTFSYANNNYGYISVTYNAITNQFIVGGYDAYYDTLTPTVFSASQFAVSNSLAWSGTNSDGVTKNSCWTTASTTTNWTNGSANAAAPYIDGNTAVTFGDANPNGGAVPSVGGVATVTIQSAGVQPAAVMFTNSGAVNGGVDYTITGGPIGGSATVELYGNGTVGGTVRLMNANTFMGPVVVAAGTLILQNAEALGNSSGVSVIAGAAVELQQSTGGPVTFGLTAGGSSSIPLNLYGTGLTSNAGELNSIGGDNTYVGAINVGSGGAQIVSSSTASGDKLTLSGGVNVSPGATLTIAGPGATTVSGAGISIADSSTLQVASGTLTLALATGSGTLSIGDGAKVTVAPTATLQLAGSMSALSDPVSGNRADIANNGSTASGGGLMIASGSQTVGTISGAASSTAAVTEYAGDTTVAPGASLTAEQILQNTLTIGVGATVTLSPSAGGRASAIGEDTAASSNPLLAIQSALDDNSTASEPITRLENIVTMLGRLAATEPVFETNLSAAEAALQSPETTDSFDTLNELYAAADANLITAMGSGSQDNSAVPLSSNGESVGVATVPEPPGFILFAIAIMLLLPAFRRMPDSH